MKNEYPKIIAEVGVNHNGNIDLLKKLIDKIPAGILGTGQDVANCVAFLASEDANYINGETIHVNGGMYMA